MGKLYENIISRETTNRESNDKILSAYDKILEASVADKHQLKILKDTVKNPAKGKFMGGPSAEEAEKILRSKFKFTDAQIKKLKENTNLKEGKMAGWIAIYNSKKLEIKKDQAKDLYGAKQIAMKHFKVPKSKMGLLAIEPAYED